MIYTCQHCGAWFSAEDLRECIRNKETIIRCNSCGLPSEFHDMRTSHIAKGYDYLSMGDFYRATVSFSTAIDDAKHYNHQASPDAYLGYALAQFRVQTIFSEEDTNRLEEPELICHRCNEMYLADSEPYLNAIHGVERELSGPAQVAEKQKFERYANRIDTIKDFYDKIKRDRNEKHYDVFIAYEDNDDDVNNRGFEFANTVRNALPDRVRDIFLPDIEEFGGDKLAYEAAILYALENSNCMLVITDNDIDHRLTGIYSRFYFNSRAQKKGGNNLGFVRYCGHITISLPDKTVADKNVYDVEDRTSFIDFVLKHNNIRRAVTEEVGAGHVVEDLPPEETADTALDDFGDVPYRSLPGRLIAFGSYPQKRIAQPALEEKFAAFGRPSPSDDKGWTVLSITKKGNPHMWYRDEEFDGKKYRCVYFSKFREVYTTQDTDQAPKEQRAHGYTPMKFYVFEFEPVVWNIAEMSQDMAVLISSAGIDSMEFNRGDLNNDYDASSIRAFLNGDFLNTAFTEGEREYLCQLDGYSEDDRVYLQDSSFDRSFFTKNMSTVYGSDYYKCIGGMGDRGVNSYWITSQKDMDDSEAAIVYPLSREAVATQYVDCTTVAVLPKIIIKL